MLKLGVALMVEDEKVVVRTLSGTTWSGHMPTRQYLTRKGKAATALSAEEYMDLLGSIFKQVTRTATRKAGHLIFVHDRDPAHRTPEAERLIEDRGMLLKMLPPRSPDLMPLDYAVFPNSKRWLEKNKPADWDERCEKMVQHLKQLKPRVLVRGYTNRLKKVVEAKGGHIEGQCVGRL